MLRFSLQFGPSLTHAAGGISDCGCVPASAATMNQVNLRKSEKARKAAA